MGESLLECKPLEQRVCAREGRHMPRQEMEYQMLGWEAAKGRGGPGDTQATGYCPQVLFCFCHRGTSLVSHLSACFQEAPVILERTQAQSTCLPKQKQIHLYSQVHEIRRNWSQANYIPFLTHSQQTVQFQVQRALPAAKISGAGWK